MMYNQGYWYNRQDSIYKMIQYIRHISTVVLTYIGSITEIFNIDGATQLPNRMRSSSYLWKAEST